MKHGELYFTLHSLEMGLWSAFIIWCFWHGHHTTAWILLVLMILDGIGIDEGMKKRFGWERLL